MYNVIIDERVRRTYDPETSVITSPVVQEVRVFAPEGLVLADLDRITFARYPFDSALITPTVWERGAAAFLLCGDTSGRESRLKCARESERTILLVRAESDGRDIEGSGLAVTVVGLLSHAIAEFGADVTDDQVRVEAVMANGMSGFRLTDVRRHQTA